MPRTALTMTLVVACSILTAGCGMTGSAGTEAVCAQWRPIMWSVHDTPETIGEVKGNNARRGAWCR